MLAMIKHLVLDIDSDGRESSVEEVRVDNLEMILLMMAIGSTMNLKKWDGTVMDKQQLDNLDKATTVEMDCNNFHPCPKRELNQC